MRASKNARALLDPIGHVKDSTKQGSPIDLKNATGPDLDLNSELQPLFG